MSSVEVHDLDVNPHISTLTPLWPRLEVLTQPAGRFENVYYVPPLPKEEEQIVSSYFLFNKKTVQFQFAGFQGMLDGSQGEVREHPEPERTEYTFPICGDGEMTIIHPDGRTESKSLKGALTHEELLRAQFELGAASDRNTQEDTLVLNATVGSRVVTIYPIVTPRGARHSTIGSADNPLFYGAAKISEV